MFKKGYLFVIIRVVMLVQSVQDIRIGLVLWIIEYYFYYIILEMKRLKFRKVKRQIYSFVVKKFGLGFRFFDFSLSFIFYIIQFFVLFVF